jgi:hypothetical protein
MSKINLPHVIAILVTHSIQYTLAGGNVTMLILGGRELVAKSIGAHTPPPNARSELATVF